VRALGKNLGEFGRPRRRGNESDSKKRRFQPIGEGRQNLCLSKEKKGEERSCFGCLQGWNRENKACVIGSMPSSPGKEGGRLPGREKKYERISKRKGEGISNGVRW